VRWPVTSHKRANNGTIGLELGERQLPGEYLKNGHAESPDVSDCSELGGRFSFEFVRNQLVRHPSVGPTNRLCGETRHLQDSRQTKVCNASLMLIVHEDIRRFHITMNNLVTVQIRQAGSHLGDEFHPVGKGILFKVIGQISVGEVRANKTGC